MIYGSVARGDSVEYSDVDVLALSESTHSAVSRFDVNVSYYKPEALRSGIGSLFGYHLQRDGMVLWEKDHSLTEVLSQLGPVDPQSLLERIRQLTSLLTTSEYDLPMYSSGLLREARYLLRSALYARRIMEGAPCFSVREIAAFYGDPDLEILLSSHGNSVGDECDYNQCLRRLHDLFGEFPESKHGSLEATIVNEWGQHSDLLSMAMIAITGPSELSDYAEVEKIIL